MAANIKNTFDLFFITILHNYVSVKIDTSYPDFLLQAPDTAEALFSGAMSLFTKKVHPEFAYFWMLETRRFRIIFVEIDLSYEEESSMSTSLLYHGFGVRGYEYVNTKYEGGAVIFTLRPKAFELQCSACGSRRVIRRGKVNRRFRSVPIGRKKVLFSLTIQRVQCLACGLVRQAKIGFADPRRRYTRAFERYCLELSRRMTIQDTALHLGVSWDVIKDIQKRYLQRRFSRPKLGKLKQIAIDEISIGKGSITCFYKNC